MAIISKATHRYVQNIFVCRILDQIAVKGKSQSVVIYELLADKDSPDSAVMETLSRDFQSAYSSYLKREWSKAKEMFQAILRLVIPEDPVLGGPDRIVAQATLVHQLAQPGPNFLMSLDILRPLPRMESGGKCDALFLRRWHFSFCCHNFLQFCCGFRVIRWNELPCP